MLTQLGFSNFRGFSNLTFNKLGEINLITGKNNCGKTSFIEGLALLSAPEKYIEYGKLIRSSHRSDYAKWLLADGANEGKIIGNDDIKGELAVIFSSSNPRKPPSLPSTSGPWQAASTEKFSIWWKRDHPQFLFNIDSVTVRSHEELVPSFADATRMSMGERIIEKLLRAMDPRIQAVRLDTDTRQNHNPYIAVDVGLSERISIEYAGHGIARAVRILAAIIANRPSIAFIDEIENGIHYSALPEVWNAVAEVAEKTNVQIFATTHSRECLVAAHNCLNDKVKYPLRVIQLYRLNENISGRVLDHRLIEAAISGEIELR